jgi:hypothetical protein
MKAVSLTFAARCCACLGLLLFFLVIAVLVPLAVPYYNDFSVMYFTGKSFLHGIPIYDYPAQLVYVKTLAPAAFAFYPYPYPPWYALLTLPLAWLPIQVAARFWFLLNLSMLSLVAWLLTPGWKFLPRSLALLATVLFIPSFGLLVVGQFSVPVLLGAAIFIHAARKKSALLWAGSLLLLTFKPHIGVLLFAAGFLWLWWGKSAQARRAVWQTLAGLVLLGLLGFLADPAWPLTYYQSLARYRDLPGVQSCGLCASLPVMLLRFVSGQSNTPLAALVGLALLLIFGSLLFWRYRFWQSLRHPATLIPVVAALTLLVDPYLLNYDYILLLLPLFWLAGRARAAALVIYFVPWLVLVSGNSGNVLLVCSGLVTFILFLVFGRNSLVVQD